MLWIKFLIKKLVGLVIFWQKVDKTVDIIKSFIKKAFHVPVIGMPLAIYYLRRKYGRRVVTRHKVKNYLLALRECRDRKVKIKSLPYVLSLDTLNKCNLTCPFCPTGIHKNDRKGSRIDFEQAKQVIDAVKAHTLEVRFYNWGEPLLNKDIFSIIRYAHDAGLYTSINSNMSLDIKWDLAKKVVESKLDLLSVSLDGLSQETLAKYRRGAKIELIKKHILAIKAERENQAASTPFLEAAFIVFKHNEHELDILSETAEHLGLDQAYPRLGYIYDENFIPTHPDFQPIQAAFTKTCEFLYSELIVEPDGSVSPCCVNTDPRWDIGKIADLDNLPKLWNSPDMLNMRRYFAADEAPKPEDVPEILCKYCGAVESRCHQRQVKPTLSPISPVFMASGKTFYDREEQRKKWPGSI